MKERKRILSITFSKHHDRRKIFEVVNEQKDVIAWIEFATTYEVNEQGDYVDVFIKLRMDFNLFHTSTEQEINSADFLFNNLTNTMGYDVSEVFNIDESRINDILPINVKLQRVEKENVKWQKN